MSLPSRFISSGFFLSTGVVMQSLTAFAANLIMVRYLEPPDFGRFAVTQATAALVLSVLSLRTNSLIIRTPECEMNRERCSLLYSVICWESLAALLAITAVMIATGTTAWTDWSLALALLTNHWTSQNRAFFERGMRFGRLSIIETGVQLAGHGLAMLLLVSGLGATSLYLRELFFALANLATLLMIGALHFYRLRWLDLRQWAAILRDGRGIWLDAMLENSFQRLTLLLVNAGSGLTGAGLFFQAQRLAIVPQQLLQPVTGRLLSVWLGQTDCSGQRQSMRKRLLLIMAPPLFVAGLVAWFAADTVVPWVFGEPWRGVAPVFATLAGTILFMPLFDILRSEAVVSKRIRWLLIARLAQYGGLIIPLYPVLLGLKITATTMAGTLSIAYTAAFAVLLLLFIRTEKRS